MHFHDETLWPSDLTATERQARRRLVLFAYQHSVYIAIITGTPLQLRERQINVQEPDDIDDEVLLALEEGVRGAELLLKGRDSWMHGWNKATDLYRGLLVLSRAQLRNRLTSSPRLPFLFSFGVARWLFVFPRLVSLPAYRNTGARCRPTSQLPRLTSQHLHRPSHHQNRKLSLRLAPLQALQRSTTMGSHFLRHLPRSKVAHLQLPDGQHPHHYAERSHHLDLLERLHHGGWSSCRQGAYGLAG